MATNKKNLTSRSRERERINANLKDYIDNKAIELKKRFEDGIIIKNNYIALLELLQNCKTKEQVDLVFQWGSENPQTGYYFKRQIENFRESARYLKKVDTINPNNEKNIKNKLIIGDNYDALNNLIAGGYKGKIDVIYIDPPYGMDNQKDFAETNYENKVARDELLSMLEPRLEKAKSLLSSEGIIFCSIDDKNQAYVKILFDRVFGETNFLCNFNWVKKHGPGGNTTFNNKIVINTEYILAYCKNATLATISHNIHDSSTLKKLGYVNKDNFFNERGLYKLTPLFRPSSTGSFQYTESLDYKIKAPDGKLFSLHCNKGGVKRGCYTWGYKTYLAGDKLGFIECHKNKDGDWVAYRKQYQFVKFDPKTHKVIKINAGSQFENIIDNFYSAEGGSDFVKVLNDKNLFTFPKPVNLIKYLINLQANKNSIIMDFFAGSGTTGQAVLELNKEDGGNRRFILCVNESGNSDEICKERLRRVMTGKTSANKSDFSWIKSNKPLGSSLNIYEIKEASVHTDENCLLDKINEENYDLPKFKTELAKIEWICDNFKVCTKKLVKEE